MAYLMNDDPEVWHPLASSEPQLARPDLVYYVPARGMPPYRYLPGVQPHPLMDPLGHSYTEEPEQEHPAWEPEQWKELTEYLYGADLFNHHYYWEAHEAWEGMWQVGKRGSTPHQFLQGLIQLAAAMVKLRLTTYYPGSLTGTQRLGSRGLERLEGVMSDPGFTTPYMGLELAGFIESMRTYLAPAFEGQAFMVDEKAPFIELKIK